MMQLDKHPSITLCILNAFAAQCLTQNKVMVLNATALFLPLEVVIPHNHVTKHRYRVSLHIFSKSRSLLLHTLLRLPIIHGSSYGILRQHGAMQLYGRQFQMGGNVRVLDGQHFVDVFALDPFGYD